ncbi:uncharacterized protein LOC114828439 [Galendromus occidentalis]|uniref:Uncharacterized protein LOC114828439 n=1 Tax=Galendromus occidentalis TaxID=34638 RepID=A0AAJ7SGW2_9ACAR|nr:uncharacterized protein LOC114828439 [Galendromus occidentalis]
MLEFELQDTGSYKFGYSIDDGWGSSNGRWEAGDAFGNKRGGYTITDADGRKRYVQYVADEKGFRVVINTNEPGTAPSHTGSAITKPAETKDEVEDEALLQRLDAKHDSSDETVRLHSSHEEEFELSNKHPSDEIDQYPAHTQAHSAHDHDSAYRTGASAPIEKSALTIEDREPLIVSKSGSIASLRPELHVSPVPVRDVPGYFSSSNTLASESVFGIHQAEKAVVPGATASENGIGVVLKNPPIRSTGWSSKKEFYREYLRKKYANQERLASRPRQVTVEHTEPVDPKTLLTYDRGLLPFDYSHLKRKLIAEDDETAVESFIPKSSALLHSAHHNNLNDGKYEGKISDLRNSIPGVSSEPVFPVNVAPLGLAPVSYANPSRHAPQAQVPSHYLYGTPDSSNEDALEDYPALRFLKKEYPVNLKASASSRSFKRTFVKRTGFTPRKYDEPEKSQPSISGSSRVKSVASPIFSHAGGRRRNTDSHH